VGQSKTETPAERYRRRAEELRDIAEKAKDPDSKRDLLAIARQYDTLANDTTWR